MVCNVKHRMVCDGQRCFEEKIQGRIASCCSEDPEAEIWKLCDRQHSYEDASRVDAAQDYAEKVASESGRDLFDPSITGFIPPPFFSGVLAMGSPILYATCCNLYLCFDIK